jgi:hypothetical protein
MREITTPQEQSVKHLAARAVVAYRVGFSVSRLSVTNSSECLSGIVCDWKSQRAQLHDDEKLLSRAFAFIYVGSIIDQEISGLISDELHKELTADMSSALDVRQTGVDWGVAKTLADTNPFAHIGYKLASRLLRTDRSLIESLARELASHGTIEGAVLRKWLEANASPLDLDDLETRTTF